MKMYLHFLISLHDLLELYNFDNTFVWSWQHSSVARLRFQFAHDVLMDSPISSLNIYVKKIPIKIMRYNISYLHIVCYFY